MIELRKYVFNKVMEIENAKENVKSSSGKGNPSPDGGERSK